jgi:hypothetical protein
MGYSSIMMSRTRVVSLSLLLLLLSGCSSNASTICNRKKDCVGGNDKDVAACEEELEGQGEVASEYGCSDANDKYVSCVADTGSCRDVGGGKRGFDTSLCKQQSEALSSCQKAASGVR